MAFFRTNRNYYPWIGDAATPDGPGGSSRNPSFHRNPSFQRISHYHPIDRMMMISCRVSFPMARYPNLLICVADSRCHLNHKIRSVFSLKLSANPNVFPERISRRISWVNLVFLQSLYGFFENQRGQVLASGSVKSVPGSGEGSAVFSEGSSASDGSSCSCPSAGISSLNSFSGVNTF